MAIRVDNTALPREDADGFERAVCGVDASPQSCPGAVTRLIVAREVTGLLAAAADEGADLISVGSTGRSRVIGAALGSVATGVVHRAPCSVLVARVPDDREFPGGILAATDASQDSHRAVEVGGAIASRHGARVIVLNVDEAGADHEIAEDAVRLIELTGAEPWMEVRQGLPRRQIVQLAAEAHASLIVVGSRGLGGARALGSVSERVAHRARCSALVVRQVGHGETPNESEER